MKRISPVSLKIALVGCVLLALTAFASAITVNPITLTLDNPNQSVAAPSSGFITLDFSGTVTVDSNYSLFTISLDFPSNSSSSNFLSGELNAAFVAFIGQSGTYTGSLFDITVPVGTPLDLYAFEALSSNPSLLTVHAEPFSAAYGVSGQVLPSASQAFSVLVTGGSSNGVPEGGSTALLLGLSVGGLLFARRALS